MPSGFAPRAPGRARPDEKLRAVGTLKQPCRPGIDLNQTRHPGRTGLHLFGLGPLLDTFAA
jgi:hypothetical protein